MGKHALPSQKDQQQEINTQERKGQKNEDPYTTRSPEQ
jgi:hypothetical protein